MNTKEEGLEALIVSHLRDNEHYLEGTSALFDKDCALVTSWLEAFLVDTQPEKVASTKCFEIESERKKFYARLSAALSERGVTDLLRKGFKFNGVTFDLYKMLPSELNESAKIDYAKNRFGVIRQLHYSTVESKDAVDFVIFMNGLPLITCELKNHYTGQTVENAIKQYQTDRDPKELLFAKKRCAVHLAVDDNDVFMCSELCGAGSRFVPFNRGNKGGKGNPVIPGKTMTSYLWEGVLKKEELSNIIENFAQVIKVKDKKTGKEKEKVIWPRYHQRDAVKSLLKATKENAVGKRFLIQHSAGSGKSNTIAWLAYQLVMLLDAEQKARFDSVVVVTDRINLDKQIRDNINAFAKLKDIVGWADKSETLKEMLQGGKQIIVSTINKFSFILDEIGCTLKDKNFAIIIDEAHSSQTGELASSLATAISGNGTPAEEEDVEDRICRIIKGRKLADNANYYAFTATPKNKTLEMFGERVVSPGGEVSYRPFHEYSMRQAIEEEFIHDVLKFYTPFKSYYRIVTAYGADTEKEFDKKRAPKKIRAFIEKNPETILQKSEVIVEHFTTKVASKIGGKARAMVVTSSIERAIEFYKAISKLLEERGGRYKAIVAFTDKVIDKELKTEAMYNGFPSAQLEDKVEEDPYRILIVADKFQTGYDQPLLHTMYVDKTLSDVKAVQTLSRLNRAAPKKYDTFVLDFANDPEEIREAFQKYYKTTILEGESDVNKLNDLIEVIEKQPFYSERQVKEIADLVIGGNDAERGRLDSVVDSIVDRFKIELEQEEQIKIKHAMKTYCRVYPFFASIMPYESEDWERHYLFYAKLVTKLPRLKPDDLTDGLIESVDFDRYRLQKLEEQQIKLENEDGAQKPIPTGQMNGSIPPVELDKLSAIVDEFNREFGCEWKDVEEVKRQIRLLPTRLLASDATLGATILSGNTQAAQISFHDAMTNLVSDIAEEKLEFMKAYFGNPQFRNAVDSRVYAECLKEARRLQVLA